MVSSSLARLGAVALPLALGLSPSTARAEGPARAPARLAPAHPERQVATDGTPRLRAHRVRDGAIVLDGAGDDAAWRTVRPRGRFRQRDPMPDAPPSEASRVRVAYDHRHLYILIEADDASPEEIRALLTRRDADSPSDWVSVVLDPNDGHRTAYRFSVNARGVKRDARLSVQGEQEDANWDGLWRVRTRRTERGWTAELAIPFSQLRYDPNAGSWGIQVERTIARHGELSVLAPTPRATSRPLLYLARLDGLKDLPPPRRIDLIPYLVVGHEWDQGTGQALLRPGLDTRFGLGSTTTVHLTLNPDFGQVESDPSNLNLSAFEFFLPERRQFFLDGQELFRVPLVHDPYNQETLYYSRRIGAAPPRELDLTEDEEEVRPVRRTSILGAAKAIGRTSDGMGFSLLQAITGREEVEVRGPSGTRREVVAPVTSYTVGRLRKEVGRDGSLVGAMASHVERFLEKDLEPSVVRRATTGVVDGELRDGPISLQAQWLGSHLEGSRSAIDDLQRNTVHVLQRPDARHSTYDPSRRSLTGWGARVTGGKLTGTPWRAAWGARVRSPELDLNDLGYQLTADEQAAFGWLQYRWDDATTWYRRAELSGQAWVTKTNGPEVTEVGGLLNLYVHLSSTWGFWLGTLRAAEALDVRLLRGGPAFKTPAYWAGWFGFHGDSRKFWDLGLEGNWTLQDGDARRHVRAAVTGNVRPTSALTVSLIPSWDHDLNDLQYVDTVPRPEGGERYLLGRLRRDTASLTLRASWAMALGLTLEAYAAPFVSTGRYHRFYEVDAPRADDLDDRRVTTQHDADERFFFGQLRSNVVVRWDYDAGGTLFGVWTHEQSVDASDRSALAPLRDAGALVGAPTSDVVMLKLSHTFML